MVSVYTSNKVLEQPANGDYNDTWQIPVNRDWTFIDAALGGETTITATGSSTITLSQSTGTTLGSDSYVPMFIKIVGAMSNDLNVVIPSGVGGTWIVRNQTTDATGGPWAVTFSYAGGGTTVEVERNQATPICCDPNAGTGMGVYKTTALFPDNIDITGNITAGGSIEAGTTITAGTSVDVGTTITAGTSISAGTDISDGIGNVRSVPPNSQATSYTLVASDAGKMINITSGDVTVPNGVFSAGQTVTILNNSNSTMNIIQGSGATVILAGTGLSGNRTLTQHGLCTVVCYGGSTYFVITGAGIA